MWHLYFPPLGEGEVSRETRYIPFDRMEDAVTWFQNNSRISSHSFMGVVYATPAGSMYKSQIDDYLVNYLYKVKDGIAFRDFYRLYINDYTKFKDFPTILNGCAWFQSNSTPKNRMRDEYPSRIELVWHTPTGDMSADEFNEFIHNVSNHCKLHRDVVEVNPLYEIIIDTGYPPLDYQIEPQSSNNEVILLVDSSIVDGAWGE